MSGRSLARATAARAICYSGIPRAVRFARRTRATLLFYHDPAPAVLEAHLLWLSRHFRFATLDLVVDALRGGAALPERSLVLTFDDGYRGNHALLPLFRRFGVRPTVYVCSGIVATRRRFWFLEPVATERCKRLPNRERLALLECATGFRQEAERPETPRQALDARELEELAPHVDFGAHTRFHPILTQCGDDEAWDEIAGSKRELEALLGRPCRHFSYPNGDYGDREALLAARAGFDSARTTDVGAVARGSDPFRLRVFGVTDDASVDVLAAQLSGVPYYLRNLARGRLGGRKEIIRPQAAGAVRTPRASSRGGSSGLRRIR
jgi:peptidoglycan/xylan/chitin deacetylase (PgdA/CDA1 family)